MDGIAEQQDQCNDRKDLLLEQVPQEDVQNVGIRCALCVLAINKEQLQTTLQYDTQKRHSRAHDTTST